MRLRVWMMWCALMAGLSTPLVASAAEVTAVLAAWETAAGAAEIEVGEQVLLAWQQDPATVAAWFDQHGAALQHWLAVQDYLFLSLASLSSDDAIRQQRDVLVQQLQGATSPAAIEFAGVLKALPL